MKGTRENKGNESKNGSLPLEIIVCERGLVAFYRHTESRDCGRERERERPAQLSGVDWPV